MLFKIFVIVQLADAIFCAIIPRAIDYGAFVEHETAQLPNGWSKVSDARDDDILNLRIALKHPNQEYLNVASAVSEPKSPSYGQYLSAKELRSILPEMEEISHLIENWLHQNEATDISSNHDLLAFSITVSQARTLLNANFSGYVFKAQPLVLRTESYSIPENLAHSIDFIFPTTQFLDSWTKISPPGRMESRQHIPKPPNCAVIVYSYPNNDFP